MRNFTDRTGRNWHVAVGKGSYGALCLLFSPRDGETAWRRIWLEADTAFEAEGQLASCSESDLCTQLERADSFDPAAGD